MTRDMHGLAQRRAEDIAKAGGVFSLAVGLVLAVLILACQPTPTHDEIDVQRVIESSEASVTHVTATISRAAIDEADPAVTLSVALPFTETPTPIVLTPDDAALDGRVIVDSSSAGLAIPDIRALCVGEGSCEIGFTVSVPAHDPGLSARVTLRLTRPLDRGAFSAAATADIVFD